MIKHDDEQLVDNMAEKVAQGEMFHIAKTPTTEPMNAFMVHSREDIPTELQDVVIFVEGPSDIPAGIQSNLRFTDDTHAETYDAKTETWQPAQLPQILTQAVENGGVFMSCNNDMLIKYEATNQLESGIGTWPKIDWATSTYQDEAGGWFNIPQTLRTALVHDQIPAFAQGGDIQADGIGYTVHTSWGSVSQCTNGNGYLIRYNADGIDPETNKPVKPDLNILTRTEESIDTYSVCTPDGRPVCGLREFDEIVQEKLSPTQREHEKTQKPEPEPEPEIRPATPADVNPAILNFPTDDSPINPNSEYQLF